MEQGELFVPILDVIKIEPSKELDSLSITLYKNFQLYKKLLRLFGSQQVTTFNLEGILLNGQIQSVLHSFITSADEVIPTDIVNIKLEDKITYQELDALRNYLNA